MQVSCGIFQLPSLQPLRHLEVLDLSGNERLLHLRGWMLSAADLPSLAACRRLDLSMDAFRRQPLRCTCSTSPLWHNWLHHLRLDAFVAQITAARMLAALGNSRLARALAVLCCTAHG